MEANGAAAKADRYMPTTWPRTILLALERAGCAKVLAMVTDSSNTYSAPAMAAVNKTYGEAISRSALIRAGSRQEAAPRRPLALERVSKIIQTYHWQRVYFARAR